MKQSKEHLPTGEARKRQLAEQRATDELWARQFGRTSKYSETLTEGHDSGAQGDNNRENDRGARSLFNQIVSGNSVVGVIR